MKIELWSDFACPFCYIGKTKFEKALNRFEHKDEVELVYKAYQLNPNAPKMMKEDPATAFAKGHRIRVHLSSSSWPLWDRNQNTGRPIGMDSELQIAEQTIYHDRRYPSYIILPVISN